MRRNARQAPEVQVWGPGWKVESWMFVDTPDIFRVMVKKRGFTGASLARSVGCSPAMISYLIHGERTCTADLALRISEALEVPLESLFKPGTSRKPLDGSTRPLQRAA